MIDGWMTIGHPLPEEARSVSIISPRRSLQELKLIGIWCTEADKNIQTNQSTVEHIVGSGFGITLVEVTGLQDIFMMVLKQPPK